MTDRERAINQDLHVLDDAHRLGRITRADYRARRRQVLAALYDSNGVVTARKALLPAAVTTTPRARHLSSGNPPSTSEHALTTLLSMRPAIAWKSLLALLAGVLLILALGYWLLRGA